MLNTYFSTRFFSQTSFFKNLFFILIFNTVIHADVRETGSKDDHFKLVDCQANVLYETRLDQLQSTLILSDANTGNFEITKVRTGKILKGNLTSNGKAKVSNVDSGVWRLCDSRVKFSKIKLAKVKDSNRVSPYIVGTGALITGVSLVSFSGGSSDSSGREISEVSTTEGNGAHIENTTNSEQGTSSGNLEVESSSDDNLLLPDDSCSKKSFRSSRANSGCGGAPESIPTSQFD